MDQISEEHKTERERRGLPPASDLDFADKRVMPFKMWRWRRVAYSYTNEQMGLLMRAILHAWYEQRPFPLDVFDLPSQHIRGIFNCDVRKLRGWWTEDTSLLVREMVACRSPLKSGTREWVFKVDEGRCAHCRADLDPDNFHVDHLVPVSQGGVSRGGNLAASCPDCNRRKGARQ